MFSLAFMINISGCLVVVIVAVAVSIAVAVAVAVVFVVERAREHSYIDDLNMDCVCVPVSIL